MSQVKLSFLETVAKGLNASHTHTQSDRAKAVSQNALSLVLFEDDKIILCAYLYFFSSGLEIC